MKPKPTTLITINPEERIWRLLWDNDLRSINDFQDLITLHQSCYWQAVQKATLSNWGQLGRLAGVAVWWGRLLCQCSHQCTPDTCTSTHTSRIDRWLLCENCAKFIQDLGLTLGQPISSDNGMVLSLKCQPWSKGQNHKEGLIFHFRAQQLNFQFLTQPGLHNTYMRHAGSGVLLLLSEKSLGKN